MHKVIPSMSSRKLVRLLKKGNAYFLRQGKTDHAVYGRVVEGRRYAVPVQMGKKSGMERGIVEGMEKGALQTLNGMVVDILEERFNIIPVRLAEKIAGVENAAVLRGLHRQAVRCESLEMFERILEKAM